MVGATYSDTGDRELADKGNTTQQISEVRFNALPILRHRATCARRSASAFISRSWPIPAYRKRSTKVSNRCRAICHRTMAASGWFQSLVCEHLNDCVQHETPSATLICEWATQSEADGPSD